MKILIFPFDLMAHYLRAMVLANKLSDKYEIYFCHSEKYASILSQTNFKSFSCKTFDTNKVMECARKFDFSWLNVNDIEEVFKAQVEVIQELKPFAVISDTSPTLKMASEFCGVKHINLTNGYMTKYYAFTRRLSRVHPAYKYSQKLDPKIFDKITDFAEKIAFRQVHKPFRLIRKKYKLKKVKNYLDELEGEINLICDLPGIFPQKTLKENYRFIGPLFYKNQNNHQELISRLDPLKATILITMGSSGDWEKIKFINEEFYSQYNIIIAGDCPFEFKQKNIFKEKFINMDSLMPCINLMICHGGNGTLYYALKYKVFAMCMPSHFEQEWNVQRLESMGFAKDISEIDNQKIQEIISKTLMEEKNCIFPDLNLPESTKAEWF